MLKFTSGNNSMKS